MQFTLPFPPSVNAMFGGGSKQQRFPSKKYKAWLANCPKLPALELERVALTYYFYFPDHRERDTENYVKAVSDYLVKQSVIKNDSWKHITKMVLMPMGVDKTRPRVEIDIAI